MTPAPDADADVVPSTVAGPLASADLTPTWLRTLTGNVDGVSESVHTRGDSQAQLRQMARLRNRRPASVLVLFGGSFDGPEPGRLPSDADVLLTRRAGTLRHHAGQVAFPGGAADLGDEYPVGTALREAREETGLDPAGVVPVAQLGTFPVPPSGFDVIPVIAHWRSPGAVRAVDAGETATVARIPLRDLLSSANRFQVQRSLMGGGFYRGPAFWVADMLVWGFTGGLLAAIFDAAGWDEPWDTGDVRELDEMLDLAGQR